MGARQRKPANTDFPYPWVLNHASSKPVNIDELQKSMELQFSGDILCDGLQPFDPTHRCYFGRKRRPDLDSALFCVVNAWGGVVFRVRNSLTLVSRVAQTQGVLKDIRKDLQKQALEAEKDAKDTKGTKGIPILPLSQPLSQQGMSQQGISPLLPGVELSEGVLGRVGPSFTTESQPMIAMDSGSMLQVSSSRCSVPTGVSPPNTSVHLSSTSLGMGRIAGSSSIQPLLPTSAGMGVAYMQLPPGSNGGIAHQAPQRSADVVPLETLFTTSSQPSTPSFTSFTWPNGVKASHLWLLANTLGFMCPAQPSRPLAPPDRPSPTCWVSCVLSFLIVSSPRYMPSSMHHSAFPPSCTFVDGKHAFLCVDGFVW